MSFSFRPEEEESEEEEKKTEEPKKERERTEEEKLIEKARMEVYHAKMALMQQGLEHKRKLNGIRRNVFRLSLSMLKRYANEWFTASELWETLRRALTDKNYKFKLTEEEFYGIFGRYPITCANNRLYKITFLLKQHPDIEWLQDGRVHKYRYIGVKKNE